MKKKEEEKVEETPIVEEAMVEEPAQEQPPSEGAAPEQPPADAQPPAESAQPPAEGSPAEVEDDASGEAVVEAPSQPTIEQLRLLHLVSKKGRGWVEMADQDAAAMQGLVTGGWLTTQGGLYKFTRLGRKVYTRGRKRVAEPRVRSFRTFA